MKKVSSANLPTSLGIFKIIVYQTKDKLEHVVLVKGNKLLEPVLVRIHSSCITGEVFSSLKCDCQQQLSTSLKAIAKSKNGILIYLNQEGRSIGLSNKIKAYALQETGLDTVQANEQLGFSPDQRSYQAAAQILKDLKINQIILLTNNPDKINQLQKYGIRIVECLPLEITPNPYNLKYLKTKKIKLGHKLKLV